MKLLLQLIALDLHSKVLLVDVAAQIVPFLSFGPCLSCGLVEVVGFVFHILRKLFSELINLIINIFIITNLFLKAITRFTIVIEIQMGSIKEAVWISNWCLLVTEGASAAELRSASLALIKSLLNLI